MAINRDLARKARENLDDAIQSDASLPTYVFRHRWVKHLVFDAGWFCNHAFLDELKNMLRIEGASVACIRSLGPSEEEDFYLLVDQATGAETFNCLHSFPAGSIGTFSGISDKGDWCIYGDGMAEIGVLAFREEVFAARYTSVIQCFGACSVEMALESKSTYVFAHIVPAWREALLQNYGDLPTTSK